MPRVWTSWKVERASSSTGMELLYSNNRYHVFKRVYKNRNNSAFDVVHLSIRNNDRSPKRDWRDFQRIKNELVGPEIEMVELYPRQSHIVDLSNQFHMWGYLATEPVFYNNGLGFAEGEILWDGKSAKPVEQGTEKAVQRPLERNDYGAPENWSRGE